MIFSVPFSLDSSASFAGVPAQKSPAAMELAAAAWIIVLTPMILQLVDLRRIFATRQKMMNRIKVGFHTILLLFSLWVNAKATVPCPVACLHPSALQGQAAMSLASNVPQTPLQ